jgi:hypothetical protein
MGTGSPLKTPSKPTYNPSTPMTLDLALSLLRRGSNGDEILQILETIASAESDAPEPTAEPIQF